MLCRPNTPRVERVTITLGEIFWPVPRNRNLAYRHFPQWFRKLPR